MDTVGSLRELGKGKSKEDFEKGFAHGFLVEIPKDSARAKVARTVYAESNTVAQQKPASLSEPTTKVYRIVRKATGAFVPGDRVFIGRDETCDIQIPSTTVSKAHAYFGFEPAEKKYVLIDKRSTNGTFLNGKRVTTDVKNPLKDGDMVSLGQDAHFLFYTPASLHSQLTQA